MGTRCKHMERYLRKEARQKHLIILLNKCDLVCVVCGMCGMCMYMCVYMCVCICVVCVYICVRVCVHEKCAHIYTYTHIISVCSQ